jgi:hypothetical protein
MTTMSLREDGAMKIDEPDAPKEKRPKTWAVPAKNLLMTGAVLLGGVATTPMRAQVQLPTVNLGFTSFEDGFAAPGFVFEEFPVVYTAGTLKDSHGATVSGENTLTSISTTSHIAYLSAKRLFGAWIGVEILVPMADVQVKLASGTDAAERGVADPILGPLALQWAPKTIGSGIFVHRFVFDLTVPIGKYNDRRPVNIGNHFVTINPYYAFTYEWKRKWEASARLSYLWNAVNADPFVGLGVKNIQPGQAFHANYATSYEVLKGFRLGLNGYWLQQLTDHQINHADVPNSKERTVGLGPGIQFGGSGLTVRANSYMEANVRNRPAGVKVNVLISKVLPTGGSKP